MKSKFQSFSANGFSLIQLIVFNLILGILVSIVPLLVSNLKLGNAKTVIVKVKNKYTTTVSESDSHKRVDVQFEEGCTSDALVVEDFWNFETRVNNSATLYASLDVGKTYELKIVGKRNPSWNRFPYVSSVTRLDREIKCPE